MAEARGPLCGKFCLGRTILEEFTCGCSRYSQRGSSKDVTVGCNLHRWQWPRHKELPKPRGERALWKAVNTFGKVKNDGRFPTKPPFMERRAHSRSDPCDMAESSSRQLHKVDTLAWRVNVNGESGLVRPDGGLLHNQDLLVPIFEGQCRGEGYLGHAPAVTAALNEPLTVLELHRFGRRAYKSCTIHPRWPARKWLIDAENAFERRAMMRHRASIEQVMSGRMGRSRHRRDNTYDSLTQRDRDSSRSISRSLWRHRHRHRAANASRFSEDLEPSHNNLTGLLWPRLTDVVGGFWARAKHACAQLKRGLCSISDEQFELPARRGAAAGGYGAFMSGGLSLMSTDGTLVDRDGDLVRQDGLFVDRHGMFVSMGGVFMTRACAPYDTYDDLGRAFGSAVTLRSGSVEKGLELVEESEDEE